LFETDAAWFNFTLDADIVKTTNFAIFDVPVMKLDASTIRLVLKLTTLKHFAEYFDRQKDKPFRSRLGN